MFTGKKAVRSNPAFHRHQQVFCPLQHLEDQSQIPIANTPTPHTTCIPPLPTSKRKQLYTQTHPKNKTMEKQYNIKNEKYPETKYFCVQGENNHTILVSMKQDLRLFAVKVLRVVYWKLKDKNLQLDKNRISLKHYPQSKRITNQILI